VLEVSAVEDLLGDEVVVEEKLDGANVVVWLDENGRLQSGLRGGPDTMDRAGQRGPLRAWVSAHEGSLRTALALSPVLYGEWMLLTHSVAYDRLQSYFVVLDLWRPAEGFATFDERGVVCSGAGLVHPPEVWRGTAGSVRAVERLLGDSRWGSAPAEGLVVRRVGPGEPRLAKLVREGFDQVTDDSWQRGRPHNRLAPGETSWR
jgi:hypothetical protein